MDRLYQNFIVSSVRNLVVCRTKDTSYIYIYIYRIPSHSKFQPRTKNMGEGLILRTTCDRKRLRTSREMHVMHMPPQSQYGPQCGLEERTDRVITDDSL